MRSGISCNLLRSYRFVVEPVRHAGRLEPPCTGRVSGAVSCQGPGRAGAVPSRGRPSGDVPSRGVPCTFTPILVESVRLGRLAGVPATMGVRVGDIRLISHYTDAVRAVKSAGRVFRTDSTKPWQPAADRGMVTATPWDGDGIIPDGDGIETGSSRMVADSGAMMCDRGAHGRQDCVSGRPGRRIGSLLLIAARAPSGFGSTVRSALGPCEHGNSGDREVPLSGLLCNLPAVVTLIELVRR